MAASSFADTIGDRIKIEGEDLINKVDHAAAKEEKNWTY